MKSDSLLQWKARTVEDARWFCRSIGLCFYQLFGAGKNRSLRNGGNGPPGATTFLSSERITAVQGSRFFQLYKVSRCSVAVCRMLEKQGTNKALLRKSGVTSRWIQQRDSFLAHFSSFGRNREQVKVLAIWLPRATSSGRIFGCFRSSESRVCACRLVLLLLLSLVER